MMQDDPLPAEEQTAFDALPRTIDPPPDLEQRAFERLRASGALRPRRRFTRPMGLAAAVVLLAAGFVLGRIVPTGSEEPAGPRYLLLLYGAPSPTSEAEAARVAEYAAWAREEAAEGRLLGGEKLGDAAIVLGDAQSGPAASPEPAGFFLIRASTRAEAEATAARCPHLRHGGTLVLKRIVETKN